MRKLNPMPSFCVALALAGTCLAQSEQPSETAFLEGQAVIINFPNHAGGKPFRLGPWRYGAKLSEDKPRDGRLNMYVVVPGDENRNDEQPEYDHTLIINAAADKEKVRDYDAYWVVVLDPKLRLPLRTERDLLLAGQARFMPHDLFEFEDLPAAEFLRNVLKMDSMQDLARFRNKDGTLPRSLTLPAGFALQASVTR